MTREEAIAELKDLDVDSYIAWDNCQDRPVISDGQVHLDGYFSRKALLALAECLQVDVEDDTKYASDLDKKFS